VEPEIFPPVHLSRGAALPSKRSAPPVLSRTLTITSTDPSRRLRASPRRPDARLSPPHQRNPTPGPDRAPRSAWRHRSRYPCGPAPRGGGTTRCRLRRPTPAPATRWHGARGVAPRLLLSTSRSRPPTADEPPIQVRMVHHTSAPSPDTTNRPRCIAAMPAGIEMRWRTTEACDPEMLISPWAAK